MAQQGTAGASAAPSRDEISRQTTLSSAHSLSTSSVDDVDIDPQLRDQGHRVGERRIRSTTRRTETVSPYPLRKTPSPVLPLVASRAQQREQQTVSEPSRQSPLPPPTLDQLWMPPSTAPPSFNDHHTSY
jgi:hypothetical protein